MLKPDQWTPVLLLLVDYRAQPYLLQYNELLMIKGTY